MYWEGIMTQTPQTKSPHVLLIANKQDSKYLGELLKKAGFDVKPRAIAPEGLTPAVAAEVAQDLLMSHTLPDGILLYLPGMKSLSGELKDDPTIEIAKVTRAKNIPMLVMDTPRVKDFTAVEREQLALHGIKYVSALDIKTPTVLALLKQLLDDRGKSQGGGLSA
jgi:hypothetical protein